MFKEWHNATKYQIFTWCFFLNFSVGKAKIITGAGIGILGALTGNQGLQQAGGGLVGLGVASSLGAHLFGKKKKWKKMKWWKNLKNYEITTFSCTKIETNIMRHYSLMGKWQNIFIISL